jgi:hypothetical protein
VHFCRDDGCDAALLDRSTGAVVCPISGRSTYSISAQDRVSGGAGAADGGGDDVDDAEHEHDRLSGDTRAERCAVGPDDCGGGGGEGGSAARAGGDVSDGRFLRDCYLAGYECQNERELNHLISRHRRTLY